MITFFSFKLLVESNLTYLQQQKITNRLQLIGTGSGETLMSFGCKIIVWIAVEHPNKRDANKIKIGQT